MATANTRQVSTGKGSTVALILAVFSLISSAIGSGLVHAHYESTHPTASKLGQQLAAGTGHVFSSIIGLPFLVLGIAVACIAALLVLVRASKGLRASGIFSSAFTTLLIIWSFALAIGAFRLLKAH